MPFAVPTNVARQVLAELVRRGEVKLSSREETAGRVEDYKVWLESYVTALLFEELGRLGKVSEFKTLPDGNDIKRDEFFRGAIPHYEEFQVMALSLATEALLGKSSSSASQPRRGAGSKPH